MKLNPPEINAACSVVVQDGNVLLGLSKETDDRHKKWCFPAGHLEEGETPEQAAARECYEETGIRTKPIRMLGIERDVAFVLCSGAGGNLRPNSEFYEVQWFDLGEASTMENVFQSTRDTILSLL